MSSQKNDHQDSGSEGGGMEINIDPIDESGRLMSTTCFLRHVLRAVNRVHSGGKKKTKMRRDTMREEMWDLVRRLQCDSSKEPPYDQIVAAEIRHWLAESLETASRDQGDLAAKFEALLSMTDATAEARKKHMCDKDQARAAAKRAMLEWDIIEFEEAEEEWHLV